ncbi:hypothetical protein BK816_03945 [Boudabousia tangfeifanii]|uniref:Hydrolase n=2 Tax=Boudabousia tangfeifanii TaxID=1912795 RepID=A0A1D9MMD8_9ACTO|nr:hypothetical protein BK816_03945 [Boudabousia tangfeifanii]
MDGTCIDSEPLWIAAEVALAKKHGEVFDPKDGVQFVGTSILDTAEYFKKWLQLPQSAQDIADEIVANVVAALGSAALQLRPGLPQLLVECQRLNLPVALVTSSYQVFADAFIAKLEQEPFAQELKRPIFSAVVTGDEKLPNKPDPAPYQAAATRLGMNPQECLAVEDSPTGLRSALNAGCQVVGIECMNPIPSWPGITELSSLADLDEKLLRKLASA